MDREDKEQVDREPDEQEDALWDKQAAAASTGKTKEPEQDLTASKCGAWTLGQPFPKGPGGSECRSVSESVVSRPRSL